MAGSFLKSGILVEALRRPLRAKDPKDKTWSNLLDREGRRGRRADVALGVVLLLSACGQTGNDAVAGKGEASGEIANGAAAEPSAGDIVEMLTNVDPRVCAVDGVQQTVVRVINSDAYNRMLQRGERFEFNSVSASGTNRDISEVTCNANIVAWNQNDYPVSWKVRPALDSDGYVVSVQNNRRLHSALGATVFSRELDDRAAARRGQETSASASAPASASGDAAGPGFDHPPSGGGGQPRTGVIFVGEGMARVAPLRVTGTEGADYYLKLVDEGTGQEVMSLYVRGGDTLQTRAPTGRYRLRYASGSQWLGTAALFGPDTRFAAANQVFNFGPDGEPVTAYDLTLGGQVSGTSAGSPIRREDF